jgi:hypothetical protein
VLTEGARKIYHGRHGTPGRRVGQGWPTVLNAYTTSVYFGFTFRNALRVRETLIAAHILIKCTVHKFL